jgi:hypothetical protein
LDYIIRKPVFLAILLVLVAGIGRSFGQAHTMDGHTVDNMMDQSFRDMYNLRFDEALKKAEAAKAISKDDPLPWVAQSCAVLFREFDRLQILRSEMFATDEGFAARATHTWDAAAKKQFDDATNGAEKIAQERLRNNKNDVQALFALTIINGLRGDDDALITKKNLSALGYTKVATAYAERLLAVAPNEYDAYVATGVGKYIIGGKAAPVRWLLRLGGLKGDQAQGIKELQMAADHGHYLAPFARIMLAFDDLRHKDRTEARKQLTWLHQQFPNNPLFPLEMTKLDINSTANGQ